MVSTTNMPTPKGHLSLPTSILTQPLFASSNSQVVLIFGQMNETPSARMRVAHTSLTMAEWITYSFCYDVLIFIDNVYRFL